ncbi:hypothetical protein GCM10010172_80220 [Paractinoplanes ferrugineus]|uniref:Uncharacterized protein n=1 Tax=Paractinoplanes ferrugineus TaxID=113564 RepID=A0A919JBT1_9ACTN|nr:hypothetical protein [Actinoplanes ferrugineus]GIE16738.1 hypothetical protein Afe05nite_85780 [Actinoplanes ferrugineus]
MNPNGTGPHLTVGESLRLARYLVDAGHPEVAREVIGSVVDALTLDAINSMVKGA